MNNEYKPVSIQKKLETGSVYICEVFLGYEQNRWAEWSKWTLQHLWHKKGLHENDTVLSTQYLCISIFTIYGSCPIFWSPITPSAIRYVCHFTLKTLHIFLCDFVKHFPSVYFKITYSCWPTLPITLSTCMLYIIFPRTLDPFIAILS